MLLQRSVAVAEEEAGAEEEAAIAAQCLLWLNCCAPESLRAAATAHAKSGRGCVSLKLLPKLLWLLMKMRGCRSGASVTDVIDVADAGKQILQMMRLQTLHDVIDVARVDACVADVAVAQT